MASILGQKMVRSFSRLRSGMRRVAPALGLVLLVVVGIAYGRLEVWAKSARPAKVILLFTEEEAAQLRLSPSDRPPDVERGADVGPHIVVDKPQPTTVEGVATIATVSPTDLNVRFEANGAPVDMQTLEVTARKGFFSKALTPLLRPFIRETRLEATRLEIPSGRFLVQIAIADKLGRKSERSYSLQVEAQE